MEIGEILKSYRQKMQLTQEAVAGYLKIPRELLSFYESGAREPSLDVLEKLADLYGAQLSDFFESSDDLVKMNVAFAFRAETIDESDLDELAAFRKIVKNYFKMCDLEQNGSAL